MGKGQYDDVIAHLRKAVEIEPESASAHFNLANALYHARRFDGAGASYRRTLELDPQSFQAHFNLGNVFLDSGQYREAAASFRQATDLKIDFAAAHFNRGVALQELGDLPEALASYQLALEWDAGLAQAHESKGLVLFALGRWAEAAESLRAALEIEAEKAGIWLNLSNALVKLERLEEALEATEAALRLEPGNLEALNNQGVILTESERFDEAMACYERALSIDPDYADVRYNRSLLLLLLGDFERGWGEFEARFQLDLLVPFAAEGEDRPWRGEDLEGKSILIAAEQGAGDNIQMIRFAAKLKRQGAHVVVAARKSLERLLRGAPGVDEVVEPGQSVTCHFRCFMFSLAQYLCPSPADIPGNVPYLHLDPAPLSIWRERIGSEGFKVGIAWAGDPSHHEDAKRSLPAALLEPLLPMAEVRLFSLQVGPGGASDDVFPSLAVVDLSPELSDFAETAAAISNLDLVISVDTAVAHLAGALAKPVWTLLPRVPDWRWQVRGETTPWYPTMRLYRQPRSGDWHSVIQRVTGDLASAANPTVGT